MRKLMMPFVLAATLPLAAHPNGTSSAREHAAAQSAATAPAPAASAPKSPAVPAAGAMAPDFSLLDETGTMRALSDLKGQTLLIAFYPKDFTGG